MCRAVFTFAVERGINRGPDGDTKRGVSGDKPRVEGGAQKKETSRRRYLSDDELRELLEALGNIRTLKRVDDSDGDSPACRR